MPETGEVELEEPSRDSVEARLEHAYALVGAGQWASGIAELRALVGEYPEADWVPEARLMVGRALLIGGKFEKAFRELHRLAADYPDSALAAEARRLQRSAARREASADLGDAFQMYADLEERAADEYEAADVLREKADAALDAGRYLQAQDEYLALVSFYPRSEWVPYCWFKVAQCEWERAAWLALGLEGVQEAERSFRDFAEAYPEHPLASEAEQKAGEARRRRAELNAQIARYYIEAEKRPWASVNYLEHLRTEFAGTPQAEWAAKKLAQVKKQLPAPPHGQIRGLTLSGVRGMRSAEEQQ
jgi:outer membrane assembly lipoprotein YfiO